MAVVVLSGAGCKTMSRMDVTFEQDALGAAPATFPAPSPPNDVLASYSSTQTTSVVVADPAGGRRLRITPQPPFVSAPDFRKRAIIVTSDAFTAGASIRGHLRLRMEGTGQLFIGLRAVNGPNSSDFLGGFSAGNYQASTTRIELLNPFTENGMEGNYPLFSSAGVLSNIASGQAVDIQWSLDQASRSLAASVSGGPSVSTTFAATSNGVAAIPIERLGLWIWLGTPSSNTAAFVDNLYVEEYK
ncbi:hypothetical protein [Myxococcus landrumensis]|uniref:Lipoprotein n=1 Tax=Myxococcus landrumensis TaxID=2813577 RepID=A0ABX7MXQ7_9BACT|nr:hypothetical protein [Myxococcus landrumus]QSQ11076.1 hypothetical protein JY572_21890 [Myxococcus landrumus]